MLLYLSYERNRKQWNIRILILSFVCCLAWFLQAFRTEGGAQERIFEPIVSALPVANSGEMTILTYNIAGLPELLSSAKTPRESSIQMIGKRINSFDLVNVQEDFNYNKFLYADNTHSYRTATMGGVPFGDGLSTLSKYPITRFERVAWADCNGADCLTPKGFSYARVQLALDVFLDVYNVHATAQDDLRATVARKHNLQQLASFIREHSDGQPVLLMGDFNAHYSFEREWIKDFQEHVDVVDSWVLLQNKGEFPEIDSSFCAKHALSVSDHCESIDKIYFRNSEHMVLTPSAYKVERALFENEFGEQLSDHCAVSLKVSWEIRNSVQ
ncbi:MULTISPECIES: endonuclease/exonuclease/phosphatase family protein [Sphingobacterium]|uniref:endonuclease/exonuclease/phosphatase family protein n=1 Tax=Sphingobacterium TaxID=28453 RepID=UPI001F09D772|nr:MULTISPECIES: endonuclease/exonuclease/phosphatase family protein [unclassified Sphingobacterium]